MAHVAHHADHLAGDLLTPDQDPLAQRAPGTERAPRRELVDDGHRRPALHVAGLEEPPTSQWDAERLEVFPPDLVRARFAPGVVFVHVDRPVGYEVHRPDHVVPGVAVEQRRIPFERQIEARTLLIRPGPGRIHDRQLDFGTVRGDVAKPRRVVLHGVRLHNRQPDRCYAHRSSPSSTLPRRAKMRSPMRSRPSRGRDARAATS